MSDSTASFKLPAFAKINLLLRVHGKRADGFHELCTLFQTISLCDELTFSPHDNNEIQLTCDDPRIPLGENNLIYKAALLLKNEFGATNGARIHLSKRIPSPGGLGGGSSDAATTLIGLVKLWQLNIETERLINLSEQLGSDVPFFLYGGTALGIGRGTEITPMKDYPHKKMLVVTAPVSVATAHAYSLLAAPALTDLAAKSTIIVCHNEAETLITEQSELRNDFEDVIFKAEPELAQVKHSLLELGAEKVLMSGSGASIFAFFSKDDARNAAFNRLRMETNWRVFDAETVSRAHYQQAMSGLPQQ